MKFIAKFAFAASALFVSSFGAYAFGVEDVPTNDLPKEFEGLSDAQQTEGIEFVFGNAIFVLFHEAGHMLISELSLPVLGKEEDAVDSLSSIMLLEGHDDTLDKALSDSADGWFLSDAVAQEAGDEYAFWDEHSLDQQRAYAMVCMMVGQDPVRFKEFADYVELPESRRERCAGDYQSAKASWTTLLEPSVITDDSETQFKLVYDDVPSGPLAPYAAIIKESDLLSVLVAALSKTYKLEPGIVFHAKVCGEPNAFWSAGDRELTFCYELVQFHASLLAKHFANAAAAQ